MSRKSRVGRVVASPEVSEVIRRLAAKAKPATLRLPEPTRTDPYISERARRRWWGRKGTEQ